MGAITQLRVLGGTISLTIWYVLISECVFTHLQLTTSSATILNNYLAPRLETIVGPERALAISNSLSAINDLTLAQQTAVRRAFAKGYNKQNIFMAVLTGIGLVTSCFLWEKKPRKAA